MMNGNSTGFPADQVFYGWTQMKDESCILSIK